jgi:hypothetical protein
VAQSGGRRSTTWNRTRKLSTSKIGALLIRDDFRCAWCRTRVYGTAFELDHVVPGGGDASTNLVVSCEDCNRRKGRRRLGQDEVAGVVRKLATPLRLEAGRKVGDKLYPWARGLRERRNDKRRKRPDEYDLEFP